MSYQVWYLDRREQQVVRRISCSRVSPCACFEEARGGGEGDVSTTKTNVNGHLFLGGDLLLDGGFGGCRFLDDAAHLLLLRGLAGSGAGLGRSGAGTQQPGQGSRDLGEVRIKIGNFHGRPSQQINRSGCSSVTRESPTV